MRQGGCSVLRDDEDGGGKEGISDEDEARKAQC